MDTNGWADGQGEGCSMMGFGAATERSALHGCTKFASIRVYSWFPLGKEAGWGEHPTGGSVNRRHALYGRELGEAVLVEGLHVCLLAGDEIAVEERGDAVIHELHPLGAVRHDDLG